MAQMNRYYYEYEDGNAARVLVPEREHVRRVQEEREERARREREMQRRQASARRNARRSCVALLGVIAVVCAFLVGYINLRTSISSSMRHIAQLQEEISDLRASNTAAENRMNVSTNLMTIKAVAMEDLGMVSADSSQIVYYSTDHVDFMTVYGE